MSERVPAGGPFKAAAGMHESLSLEHLGEARRLLSSYCGSGEEYCCRVVSILRTVAPLVARARIEDLALSGQSYEGLDKPVLGLFSRLAELYAEYISGLLLTHGEDVIVQALRAFELEGVRVWPGEYVRLPPARALALVAAGLARPARALAIKAGGDCGSGEGGREE